MKRTRRFPALMILLVVTLGMSASRNAVDDTREVRIDVSVSDKKGNAVRCQLRFVERKDGKITQGESRSHRSRCRPR